MALSKAYDQYRENSVFTSSTEELTLMLYNGLVRFIMKAQAAIDEKDIEKANNCIIRAQDIILYLLSTLNTRYDISNSLALIYDYMCRRLVDANVEKDPEIIQEVEGLAKELRDTWSQAIKIAKKPARPQQPAANGQ